MKIFCYDEFAPQDTAMMQALYSRSALSVEEHVEKVKTTGSGKFMESFYVGYGHASIADCGSTTIFLEGVSTLVTKAFQAHPLYSGQETSSRYIDMSKQAIFDPVANKESKAILAKWMKFYVEQQENVRAYIREKYPRQPGEDEKVYDKAVKARSFDVLRGFLPVGITTQFSWHTNLRQAHDALDLLLVHPLDEVKLAAKKVLQVLQTKYPQSFSHPLNAQSEAYRQKVMKKYAYYFNSQSKNFAFKTNIKTQELDQYHDVIKSRPSKTLLPNFLSELGNTSFEFLLDFGSFRDIQRHRNGFCQMPLVNGKFGFNEWYLSELPTASRKEAEQLIKEQQKAIAKLKTSVENKQYYFAMGFNCSCKVSYPLPAAVYVAELRSGSLVHPSLRKVAHQMSRALIKKFPKLKLHSDFSQDQWSIRRGEQDIVSKK